VSNPPPHLIEFALRLADAARIETLPRWRASIAAENKGLSDYDPVTEADREAERVMREMIQREQPDHGVAGEEFPDVPTRGRYCWSLDPVDGTRSFICRLPTWVTLIALLEDGQPILGVIDAPCLDERYLGHGASSEDSGLLTSGCRTLAEARLSTTDPYLFTGGDGDRWERLRQGVRTTRYGHDGYAYARLASGSIDLVVECGLKPHDYHALIPVVRAAGGVIGGWLGGEDFSGGNLIAAATPELFEAAVKVMR
jgi:myo-inositol-1(or 4)-monophosphatase